MRKALVVGINDYPTCPLTGCVNDAELMKALLSHHENGDPNFQVMVRTDLKTRGELKQLIENCFSGHADTALFYFSGHGHVDSIGGYLVTPDFSAHDYGISLQDLLSIANRSECKEKIIILDCCYSGMMGSISTVGQNTTVIGLGVTIMTASREDEAAKETGEHGLFTSLLAEALGGGAADVTGKISIGSIYAFIDKALGPWDQRPMFKTNVSRFTSIRDVKPRVPLDVIRKLGDYFSEPTARFRLDPSYEPTNSVSVQHEVREPYAVNEHTEIFACLQQMARIGLVEPVGAEHMYFAAIESKSCALTAVGRHYWNLIKNDLL